MYGTLSKDTSSLKILNGEVVRFKPDIEAHEFHAASLASVALGTPVSCVLNQNYLNPRPPEGA